MSEHLPQEALIACDLPKTVQLAGQLTGLDSFLEDAVLGFHWDLLDRLEDGAYILDTNRRIMYWSAAAERITGYSAAEVLGRSCRDNILCHVDATGACLCLNDCPMVAVMNDGQPRSADIFLRHCEGHRVPVHVYGAPIRNLHGEIIGAFETFSETTARTADLERIRELEAVAFLDTLTGVANRRFLQSALEGRFAEFHRERLGFGLVLIDVDRFKRFNDQYGHETGDDVLKMIARTLTNGCRPYDLVSRWGGEEFAVLTGSGSPENVMRFAERLRGLVQASSLDRGGQALQVTISLGATTVRENDDPSSLLSRADSLLYRSKSAGRNRVTSDS